MLDGELTENRPRSLREHVAACASCAAELRALEALASRLRAPVAGAADAAFIEAVGQRLPAAGAPAFTTFSISVLTLVVWVVVELVSVCVSLGVQHFVKRPGANPADSVEAAIERASQVWRRHRDERELREALERLLAILRLYAASSHF